jgi:23S rRNA (uracil1939-C5)-methyltransferase
VTELVDVDIDFLDVFGDGIARHRRQTIVVPFTIPGERVRIRIARDGAGVSNGSLVAVLRASPHRVVARCPHFGPCGGCAWQHIAYPEQLRLKTAIVQRLLREALPDAPTVALTLAGTTIDDPWGYRHKVHFVYGYEDPRPRGSDRDQSAGRAAGGLVMGHYARGTRRIVPVRECPVHDPRGNRLAFELRDRYARAQVGAADARRATFDDRRSGSRGAPGARGVLKSLAVRVGSRTGELMATLVVTADTDKRLRGVTRRVIESDAAITSFHLNLHSRGDAYIFGPETRRLAGAARLREEVAGTSFLISPTAFFQTNVHAAECLVKLVLDAIPSGAKVLDLYAGAGLFALPLARAGHVVVAVEDNVSSVEDGEASLRLNRIPPERCTFVARSVEVALRRARSADAVVLDPPREGCSASALEAIFGAMQPKRVVYVSCNPEALARDLKVASRFRYRIDSVQPVDMFPHTSHIETVAVIYRR